MNVLLIGGTGVLSSAVVAEAKKEGISVTMVNRGKRRIPEGVEHVKADKNNTAIISEALTGRKFDAVIDFLCYSSQEAEKSIRFYSNYTDQYIFISSTAVYNTKALGGKMGDELSPKVTPEWDYSVEKWKSEELIRSLAKELNVNYTIIRPAITYGNTRIPYGISPRYGYHWTLCARILAGKPIIVWNGGENRCNMMRVEDFAVGVVGLIGNAKAYNQAFNICGDEAPSWNDVLGAVGEAIGKEVITVEIMPAFYAKGVPSRYGELIGGRAVDSLNSNKKIKDAVPAFEQKVFLKEGVAQTIDAYKSSLYQSGIDWRFDAETDRIIKKWCRQNHIPSNHYNLHFIDYLGSASRKDRITYLYALNKDSVLIHLYEGIKKKLK